MGKKEKGKKQGVLIRLNFFSFVKKALLLVGLFVFVFLPFAGIKAASIYGKQQELDNIRGKIDQYKSKADQTKNQIDSLKTQINSVDNQMEQTRLEIKSTKIEIEKTNLVIKDTNEKIKKRRKELKKQEAVLDEAIRYIYEEGDAPLVETFLSSNSFSEVLDRTEYLQAAQMKIEKTINRIEGIKKELEKKRKALKNEKKKLVDLKKEQNTKLASLNSQQNIKQNILSTTKNKEEIYQKKLSSLSQQQQAILNWLGAHINYGEGCTENCGSKYWCQPQCVTYVKWKTGKSWGNAHSWDNRARAEGYTVDRNPSSNSVAVWERGYGMPYGHVAWVESVNGSSVTVSQHNWGCNCCYSTMTFSLSKFPSLEFIHF